MKLSESHRHQAPELPAVTYSAPPVPLPRDEKGRLTPPSRTQMRKAARRNRNQRDRHITALVKVARRFCPSVWWREQVPRIAFPPAADHTPMRQCDMKDCQRYFPAYYVEVIRTHTGKHLSVCVDCRSYGLEALHVLAVKAGLLPGWHPVASKDLLELDRKLKENEPRRKRMHAALLRRRDAGIYGGRLGPDSTLIMLQRMSHLEQLRRLRHEVDDTAAAAIFGIGQDNGRTYATFYRTCRRMEEQLERLYEPPLADEDEADLIEQIQAYIESGGVDRRIMADDEAPDWRSAAGQ